MYTEIFEQPKCFEHMPDIFRYLEINTSGGKVCGWMAFRDTDWQRQIHFEIIEWSHNIAKQIKKEFQEFKQQAKADGLLEICITFPERDTKVWEKFIKLFDFPKPEIFHISIMDLEDG